ncbi:MAG: hypothetical protein ABI261_07805 [Ginsengibacter sp.]
MKKLFLFVMAGFLFVLNTNAQVTRNTNPSQRVQSDSSSHHQRGHMMDQLNLTPDQKSQMKLLRKSNKQERDAIQNDASLSQQLKMEKMKELRESQTDKMNSILTPDQQDKRNAYIQKMRTDRKMNGKRHKNFNNSDSTQTQ